MVDALLYFMNTYMKVSKILAYIIGLSNIPLIILGQDTNCYIDVNDTAKCYYLLKYTKPPIILEKNGNQQK